MLVLLSLTLVATALAGQIPCQDEVCADSAFEGESDAAALLQKPSQQVAQVLAPSVTPTSTRPSDIDALDAFWQSVKGEGGGCAPGWGNRSIDPCAGDATDPHNSQGFGQWKGLACVPCPDEPQYFCAAEIFLDGKCLLGSIPETFAGLSELWWVLLTTNNITGPLPRNNWKTLPKLVSFDVSHNNICGTFPLDDFKELQHLKYLEFHHNELDSITYTGGGFPELLDLIFIYNRNLTAVFPDGFAGIPKLERLEMHDTHISSSTPVPTGPWENLELLLISGTYGLCGPPLPCPCSEPGTYCDLVDPLPLCGENPAPTVGTTRPSDVDALDNFWKSVNQGQGNAPGWGNRSLDPCAGDATDPHNAQGFGQWKGVACVPCPNEPEYLCVSQIWLDHKGLTGPIPENFTGLTELWFLLLTTNHMTGSLPVKNWVTFPKLVYFDISYNNFTGTLPLTEFSKLPALRYLTAHHNMLDELCYRGGGFPSLFHLSFIYNRNMTGIFPPGFAEIPKLRTLEMHDTHLRGRVPAGPWKSLDLLLISGTGGLCGNLPDACARPGTHCDLRFGDLSESDC